MTARYRVLISTELLEGDIRWPDGVRLTGPPLSSTPDLRSHWCELEDDDADPALNGKRVDLTLSLIDGRPVITERKVITS